MYVGLRFWDTNSSLRDQTSFSRVYVKMFITHSASRHDVNGTKMEQSGCVVVRVMGAGCRMTGKKHRVFMFESYP